jgi:hypothetical protein
VKRSIPFGLLVVCGLVSACVFSGSARSAHPENSVWVCHGGRDAHWQRVSARAAEAHQRHGDQVSREPQPEGARCGGGDSDHNNDHRN